MEAECDGNVGEISKSMSSIGVYLIFYTFTTTTKSEKTMKPFLQSLCFFVCLSAVGRSEQTGRAVWGPWLRFNTANQTADVTFGAIFII